MFCEMIVLLDGLELRVFESGCRNSSDSLLAYRCTWRSWKFDFVMKLMPESVALFPMAEVPQTTRPSFSKVDVVLVSPSGFLVRERVAGMSS